MSYGEGIGRFDVGFVCESCGVEVVIRLPVGKDYSFEEMVHEAFDRLVTHCGWEPHGWQDYRPLRPIRCYDHAKQKG